MLFVMETQPCILSLHVNVYCSNSIHGFVRYSLVKHEIISLINDILCRTEPVARVSTRARYMSYRKAM
jgi:hypothetical protein